MSMGKQSI